MTGAGHSRRHRRGRSAASSSSCRSAPAARPTSPRGCLAERLSAKWGKPVVIENRPGGDGLVAINAFISANDDHVLLYASSASFMAHPYTQEKLPYDLERDLAPIAQVCRHRAVGQRAGRSRHQDAWPISSTAARAEPAKYQRRRRRGRAGVRAQRVPEDREPRRHQGALSRRGAGRPRSRRSRASISCCRPTPWCGRSSRPARCKVHRGRRPQAQRRRAGRAGGDRNRLSRA